MIILESVDPEHFGDCPKAVYNGLDPKIWDSEVAAGGTVEFESGLLVLGTNGEWELAVRVADRLPVWADDHSDEMALRTVSNNASGVYGFWRNPVRPSPAKRTTVSCAG